MTGGLQKPREWFAQKFVNRGRLLPMSSWFCFAPSSNPGSVRPTSCALSLPLLSPTLSLCLRGRALCVQNSPMKPKGLVLLLASTSLDSPTRASSPLSTLQPIYLCCPPATTLARSWSAKRCSAVFRFFLVMRFVGGLISSAVV